MPKTGFILLYCRVGLYRFYLLKSRITHLHTLKCVIFSFVIQYNITNPIIVTLFRVYKWFPYHRFFTHFKVCRNLWSQFYGVIQNAFYSVCYHVSHNALFTETSFTYWKLDIPIHVQIPKPPATFPKVFSPFPKGNISKEKYYILLYFIILVLTT